MRKPRLDDLVERLTNPRPGGLVERFYLLCYCTVGILLVSGMFVSCTGLPDPDGAYHVLETNGYSFISITGRRVFGCGEGDVFRTGFTAKSPNGQSVTGVVCKGILKGHTIRFD